MSGRTVGPATGAVLAVLVLVAGMVSGVAAVLVHGHPWGLALAWAAGLAAVWALPPTWWGRPPFAFGWLLVLAVVLLPRPEGDFLLADDLAGYLLLGSGMVLAAAAMLGLRRRPD